MHSIGACGTLVLARLRLWQTGSEPPMATGATFEPSSLKAPAAGNAVLTDLVRRLVEAYHPERIYLFGSKARGDAGPDSDFDLS